MMCNLKVLADLRLNLLYNVRIEKTGIDPIKFRNPNQNIRKTCSCNEYPLKPHFYIVKLGFALVYLFLARLHEVHRAIAVTPVVHVPVPVPVPVRVPVRVRVTLALKFSRSPYLDNHSSESIHTWTIDTL